jgi:hypothetical protein
MDTLPPPDPPSRMQPNLTVPGATTILDAAALGASCKFRPIPDEAGQRVIF